MTTRKTITKYGHTAKFLSFNSKAQLLLPDSEHNDDELPWRKIHRPPQEFDKLGPT